MPKTKLQQCRLGIEVQYDPKKTTPAKLAKLTTALLQKALFDMACGNLTRVAAQCAGYGHIEFKEAAVDESAEVLPVELTRAPGERIKIPVKPMKPRKRGLK